MLAAALSVTLPCAADVAGKAGTAPGYFRYPAISGDTVVFAAEGDLWRVPIAGGRLPPSQALKGASFSAESGRWQ